MTEATPTPDPKAGLYADAVSANQELKRKHREFYRTDPKAFREVVRKAWARSFRLKPGPKRQRNPLIAKAARERGRRAAWKDLYPAYVPGWADMNEYTRSYAEDGFRQQVNVYLRNHPRLKFPAGIVAKDAGAKPGQ